jgi:hypothetical protein
MKNRNTSKSLPLLPDSITNDMQLRNWCRDYVPGFVDVIDRTQFEKYYRNMKPGESLIINLDPGYKQGGTHWTALRISSEAPLVYYKDSFGAPCPKEIIDNVKKYGNRGLIYGNRINQKTHEDNCGKRASYFLRDMAKCANNGEEIECFKKLED